MDSLKIQFIPSLESNEKHTRFDWFLCSNISAHFLGCTFRNLKLPKKKIRIGIDEHDDSIENHIGSSLFKDYIVVKIPDLEFVIAKVLLASKEHAKILVDQAVKLYNNYRPHLSFADENTKKCIPTKIPVTSVTGI